MMPAVSDKRKFIFFCPNEGCYISKIYDARSETMVLKKPPKVKTKPPYFYHHRGASVGGVYL